MRGSGRASSSLSLRPNFRRSLPRAGRRRRAARRGCRHHSMACSRKTATSAGITVPRCAEFDEDVPSVLRSAVEPVRIVEGAAIDADRIGKTLERQEQLCAAGRAEVDADPLAAAARAMVIDARRSADGREGGFFEHRLDHVGGPGGALAEAAMAYRDPERRGVDAVADRATETASFVDLRHIPQRSAGGVDRRVPEALRLLVEQRDGERAAGHVERGDVVADQRARGLRARASPSSFRAEL